MGLDGLPNLHSSRLPPPLREKILQMLPESISYAEIARRVGCNAEYVSRIAKEEGYKTEDRLAAIRRARRARYQEERERNLREGPLAKRKQRIQAIRDYHAAHPEASAREIAAIFSVTSTYIFFLCKPFKHASRLSEQYPNEYQSYNCAAARCSEPRLRDYRYYGGRGIQFLFTSFEEFMKDIGPKPSYERTAGGRALWTLDRIDNDGHYAPGNVRWATMKEQVKNRRRWGTATASGTA